MKSPLFNDCPPLLLCLSSLLVLTCIIYFKDFIYFIFNTHNNLTRQVLLTFSYRQENSDAEILSHVPSKS